MHSAIYTGQLRHRRFAPRAHEFSYRLFMVYVDLTELDEIFRHRWLWSVKHPALAWLRRADYLGDSQVSLDQAVRDRVESETGARPCGPIRMLTHLRYFGYNFNPVSFYYCYDETGCVIETIVAEITNTPWKERHAYVLTQRMNSALGSSRRYEFKKEFHVSPFMAMNFNYDWRFSAPGERLAVHMENKRDGDKAFDATLDLRRREITGATLAKALLAFPCMTATVVLGIYWQALQLWLKRIPFHTHPAKSQDHERNSRPSPVA
ncbi:MAG TPA: DUF1365 domain-containing protein [Steroidobacteraceae bacterium]|nr:DUF1365 domain-containing protein [Steroidobacteraceae bacterium]